MRSRDTLTGRIVSLLFAVVFLAAAQGQALGLRHCSLHDALPGSGPPGSGHHAPGSGLHPSEDDHRSPLSSSSAHSEHDDGHAAQERGHAGALGGCVDDCHLGSGTVAAGPTGVISSAHLQPSPGPVAGTESLRGPRHASYELHLPNAPPLFA